MQPVAPGETAEIRYFRVSARQPVIVIATIMLGDALGVQASQALQEKIEFLEEDFIHKKPTPLALLKTCGEARKVMHRTRVETIKKIREALMGEFNVKRCSDDIDMEFTTKSDEVICHGDIHEHHLSLWDFTSGHPDFDKVAEALRTAGFEVKTDQGDEDPNQFDFSQPSEFNFSGKYTIKSKATPEDEAELKKRADERKKEQENFFHTPGKDTMEDLFGPLPEHHKYKEVADFRIPGTYHLTDKFGPYHELTIEEKKELEAIREKEDKQEFDFSKPGTFTLEDVLGPLPKNEIEFTAEEIKAMQEREDKETGNVVFAKWK